MGNHTIKHVFDISRMMAMPYRNDIMQNEYFVIDGFKQLYDNISEHSIIEAYISVRQEVETKKGTKPMFRAFDLSMSK